AVAGDGLALVGSNLQAAEQQKASEPQAKDRGEKQATDRYGDPLPPGALARLGTLRLRHIRGGLSLAFSPDGKRVVSGGDSDTSRLWDVSTGKELHRFVGREGWVTSVHFALDGKTLVTGGYGSFSVWDTATGEEVPFPRGGRNGPLGQRVALA